ncbi:MAG: hypothetical protein PHN82_08640 [bacterium]|nr:hypothetical protein [bacterium]
MQDGAPSIARTIAFAAALAAVAAIYSFTIFSNLCIDGDTLDWAAELARGGEGMTLKGSFAVMGWFTKFHLLMFVLLRAVTGLLAPWRGWDYLLGFKLITLACALLTPPLLLWICRRSMRSFPVMLVTSFIPLFTLGYSWLITTCDDNVLANLCTLAFLACVLVASGALMERERERRCGIWAFAAGVAAGISMASHMKNIVSLPLLLAPALFPPPRGRTREGIAAASLLGLLLSFGLPYLAYWTLTAGEPASSKLDFWVFHRVSGRFFFTPGPRRPLLADHLVFVLAGIRSSLYAFQELVVHTDLHDGDPAGPVLIALFFAVFLASAWRVRRRRIAKILFALFLLDAGHSFFYDSWVVERWDSFTLPVFLTIGLFWDEALSGAAGRFARRRLSALLLIFYGALVWANVSSTRLLIGVTNGSIPARIEEKTWWAGHLKFYFYFDHRGIRDLSRRFDSFFDDRTWCLSPAAVRGISPHVAAVIDRYLTLDSRRYPGRRIDDPSAVQAMVERGELRRLLYLDTVRAPLYGGTGRSAVRFDPSMRATVYENSQVVLGEAVFAGGGSPPPPEGGGEEEAGEGERAAGDEERRDVPEVDGPSAPRDRGGEEAAERDDVPAGAAPAGVEPLVDDEEPGPVRLDAEAEPVRTPRNLLD